MERLMVDEGRGLLPNLPNPHGEEMRTKRAPGLHQAGQKTSTPSLYEESSVTQKKTWKPDRELGSTA